MGCGGQRDKGPPEQTQKWAYLSLSDFKSTSSWNTLAYIWLWVMAFVALAVYTADTYTAVNLLAFNNWTMKIKPALDIKYSRWIFAGCILFSWVLAILEWIRAIRVIRRGGVAESYMDPLAVSLQSMRPQGWRRFLVFTSLTKSKKGTDYIAFFVYFAFKGAIRVILAEGPRQVINGLTLYAVMKADLFAGGPDDDPTSIGQFWDNLRTLFEDNKVQAMTMVTMLFTLAIWVISALSLLLATVLYLVFLWHYIPQSDGRLSIYCRRKIDRRLEKIVDSKVQAAIEDEERAKRKAEEKAELKRQRTGELPLPTKAQLPRQPTLPQVAAATPKLQDDKLPDMPLNRQNTSTTVSTLPVYTSRPPSRPGLPERNPTLPPDYSSARPAPSRFNTDASGRSNVSYESDAPLLANAGYAGNLQDDERGFARRPVPSGREFTQDSGMSYSPAPPMPRSYTPQGPPGPPPRSFTPQGPPPRSFTPGTGPQRSYTPQGPPPRQGMGPRMPIRTNTGMGYEQQPPSPFGPGQSEVERPPARQYTPFNDPSPASYRNNSTNSFASRPTPQPPQHPAAMVRNMSLHSHTSSSGSFSRPLPPRQFSSTTESVGGGYRAFSPVGANGGMGGMGGMGATGEEAPLQSLLREGDSYEMMPPHSHTNPQSQAWGEQSAPPQLQPGPQRTYTPFNPHAAPQAQPPALENTSAGAGGTGGYIPFNPSASAPLRASPAPYTPTPPLQRSATALPASTQEHGDYFGNGVPQRSATAPVPADVGRDWRDGHEEDGGYGDLVEDYGGSSPGGGYGQQDERGQWQGHGQQRW